MLYDMEKQSFFMSIVKADFFKMAVLKGKMAVNTYEKNGQNNDDDIIR